MAKRKMNAAAAETQTPAPAAEAQQGESSALAPPQGDRSLNEALTNAAIRFGEWLGFLAQEAENHPQGMCGAMTFAAPRPLPEDIAPLAYDGVWAWPGARWQWAIEDGAVVRGWRLEMVDYVTEAQDASAIAE